VSLLGGLMQDQDTKSMSGVPGLSSIPILGKLFTSNTVEKDRNELLIALIPHIVRTPGSPTSTCGRLRPAPNKTPI